MNETELMDFLDEHRIPYRRFDHPPVYTVEQAAAIRPALPGTGTKNLLLRDPAGQRTLLLMTLGDKRVDLKAFAAGVGLPKVTFAPVGMLETALGVERGAVTALGLVNDRARLVELWVDRALWQAESLHCHPLVNTATLVMAPAALETFFALCDHPLHFVDVQEKA